MPEVPVAPGIAGVAQFMATGIAPPGTVALQVPPAFSGLTIMTPDFVRRAHDAGYAVHVWFSGQEESERVYREMLDMGADGLMPAKPGALERELCARNTGRPADTPAHCGGGRAVAAEQCVARVRSERRAGHAPAAPPRPAGRRVRGSRPAAHEGRGEAGRHALPLPVRRARNHRHRPAQAHRPRDDRDRPRHRREGRHPPQAVGT